MNNNKYLLIYNQKEQPNQTKAKFFEHLSDARIFANNLPDSAMNIQIYELFETYEEEKEEDKTELDCFFEEFNRLS